MNVGTILVNFGADVRGLIGGIKLAEMSLGSFGVAAAAITGIVAGVAVALAVVAVDAAAKFQASILRLFTTAGELHGNLQMVGDGILAMSTQVGYGAQQLVQAMYWIESGGRHGADGLATLRIAAEGAKTENSNLDTVARALMATLNAYRGTGLTAAQAMNTLIASTANGMMTLQELSGVLSNVLPVAAKFHISLIDIGAGLATMTAMGDPAAQAATHLRQVILAIESPAAAGAKAIRAIGLTTQQVSDEMRTSLPGAIEMITTALGKKFPEGSAAYNNAMKAIAGGNKQLLALLDLSGTSLQIFKNNVLNIAAAVRIGGKEVMGWADVQGNFNTKMDQAKAAVQAILIIIGQRFLPVLSQLLDKVLPILVSFTTWVIQSHIVEDSINKVVDAIGKLIAIGASIITFFKNSEAAMALLKGTLAAVAVVIAVSLVTAFYAWAVAAGAAAIATIAATWPILLVAAAVGLAVAAFIYFYNTSPAFRGALKAIGDAFASVWAWINAKVIPALQSLWSWIQSNVVPALQNLWGWINNKVVPALQLIWTTITTQIKPTLDQLVITINTQLIPAWQGLVKALAPLGGYLDLLKTDFKEIWKDIQPLLPLLDQLKWGLLLLAAPFAAVAFGLLLVAAALAAFVVGLATAVRGATIAVGGIAQAFSGLVQLVSGYLQALYDLIHGNFDKIGKDMKLQGDGWGMLWQGVWNVIQGIWFLSFGAILAGEQAFGNLVIGIFMALYHALVGGSIVPDMVNAIINWFALMVSQGIAKANDLVTGVTGALSSLPSVGLNAGLSLAVGVANGITAGIGAAIGAAQNLAAQVASYLPHSPAKQGPLRDLDKFGPALTGGFAAGIVKGTPGVLAAVNTMVQPAGSVGTHVTASGSRSNERTNDLLEQILRELGHERGVTRGQIIDALGSALVSQVRASRGPR